MRHAKTRIRTAKSYIYIEKDYSCNYMEKLVSVDDKQAYIKLLQEMIDELKTPTIGWYKVNGKRT